MLHDAGILTGRRYQDASELLVLALTPGIPFEWVTNVSLGGDVRRAHLKRLVRDATDADHALALENFQSITEQDAYRMLQVTAATPRYRGAIPLHAQLYLQADPRTDAAFAKSLGIGVNRVRGWRTKIHFDPLTGARL